MLICSFPSFVGDTGGNCNKGQYDTLSCSDDKQARVITLTLHMLSRILSLPVEQEQNHFTLAEVLNQKTNFDSLNWLLEYTVFSSAVNVNLQ